MDIWWILSKNKHSNEIHGAPAHKIVFWALILVPYTDLQNLSEQVLCKRKWKCVWKVKTEVWKGDSEDEGESVQDTDLKNLSKQDLCICNVTSSSAHNHENARKQNWKWNYDWKMKVKWWGKELIPDHKDRGRTARTTWDWESRRQFCSCSNLSPAWNQTFSINHRNFM